MSILLKEPSSWLQAAVSRWAHPVEHDWIVAAHTYDLLAAVNSKKQPKPYPTPWPSANQKRVGPSQPQRRNEVISRLEQMNPKENDGS